ncbi:hypothetical protein SUGI_0188230 [Cryptomeria japonica]|nr:hypothetical protein SUGI_0188230 [Cryptomeria japonica]
MIVWVLLVILLGLCAIPTHEQRQHNALKKLLKVKRSHGIKPTQWSSSSHLSPHHDEELLQKEKDRIEALPGQPSNVTFQHYSGYVTVDSNRGRALFYYFVEAIDDHSTKPLLLWLNGGPGCSSLGYGAMLEIGPFRVNPDCRTLSVNPYAWNQVANTLFLEAPAGVGFSYSNTSADYKENGDKRTAEDSFAFLVKWFERFPQYKHRDFYIAGESYAGYYIPELADTILNHKNKSADWFINLKGIMVGNGIMNAETDGRGMDDHVWTHALISDQTYEALKTYCNYSTEAPVSPLCDRFENKTAEEIGYIQDTDIYAPVCMQSSSSPHNLTTHSESNHASNGYDPCGEKYLYSYLNNPDVQSAFHANITTLPYPWDFCSDIVSPDTWKDSPWSMLPIYNNLIANGLQILIFSGDVDIVVPVTSTRYSINALKLPIESPWHPWMSDGEVGGYSVVYKGLTFATVRGAGHQVPTFQPARALTMLNSYLQGKPLPLSKHS